MTIRSPIPIEPSMTTGIPKKLIKPWKLPPRKTYLFKNANVVDPINGTVAANRTVRLAHGRITSLEDQSALEPAATVVDLDGKFLCPGLIDSHIHIAAVPGSGSLAGLHTSDQALSLLRQPFACAQTLARGFTTVRDCGGATLALKEALADGVFAGPRLFMAGRALSQTGGHGDARGPHDQCGGGGSISMLCDGEAECVRAAREQLRTGADFIKIMVGGGVASPTDRLGSTQFTATEVRAICEVAASCDTWVTAHAYTPRAIRHAVVNGVKGIEHGNFLDRETAELMAEKGVWLTPTLVTYEAMASKKYAGFLPPENQEKNREVLAKGLKSLEVAAEAGVAMCYGSDLLGPLTAEQGGEFAIRAKALSPKLVLQAATTNPARMLRQEAFLGQVNVGFAADLLVLNTNPLEDITVLGKPEKHLMAVIKDGRVYCSRWSKLPVDVVEKPEMLE